MQDFLLLMIIFAFFSCGTSIQGAGSRLLFSYSRDEALPASKWISRVHPRFGTPVNALIAGATVTALFVLLVFASPAQDKHFLFITYPGGVNALVALVSFGVSGIYLSFLMTVIAAWVARARGWVPEGRFTLGRWGTTVTVIATLYLGLMLINVVLPSGLSSPRAYFNLDWITLLVMFVIAVVGAIYFFAARPDRGVRHHLHDDLEPTGAERELAACVGRLRELTCRRPSRPSSRRCRSGSTSCRPSRPTAATSSAPTCAPRWPSGRPSTPGGSRTRRGSSAGTSSFAELYIDGARRRPDGGRPTSRARGGSRSTRRRTSRRCGTCWSASTRTSTTTCRRPCSR